MPVSRYFLRFMLLLFSINQISSSDSSNSTKTHSLQHGMTLPGHGNLSHSQSSNRSFHGAHDSHAGVHVASWNFDFVEKPFILTMFMLAIAVVKIIYHHCKRVAAVFPESCLLIIMGLGLGCMFLIILEAAYSLKDRTFYENTAAILVYAVVGSILNTVGVGLILYGLSTVGAFGSLEITMFQCLIFSSLIAAVDPVAVLAIFQEVGVNKVLYFMVFGESLFNDAVTIVLYNLMISFDALPVITGKDIGLGLAAFLCVSIGGLCIGIICGFICSFVTKYTSNIRVVEPVLVFGLAYTAYLLAEMVHFSGIISIIACGLIQSQYAFENVSLKSYITVHYFSRVASSITESLIFIILGVMLVNDHSYWNDWNTSFSILSLVFVILTRFVVIFSLTYSINAYMFGTRAISLREQFIMSYGGLRGAVSFSLVFMLSDTFATKNTMLCATYLIILFTVFVQGITLKPLVSLLNIRLAHISHPSVIKEVNRGIIQNTKAGVEGIIAHRGASYWTALSKYVSQRFIRPAVQTEGRQKSSGMLTAVHENHIREQVSIPGYKGDHLMMVHPDSANNLCDMSNLTGTSGAKMMEAREEHRKNVRGNLKAKKKLGAHQFSIETDDGLHNLRKLMVPVVERFQMNAFDRNLGHERQNEADLVDEIKYVDNLRRKSQKSTPKHQNNENARIGSQAGERNAEENDNCDAETPLFTCTQTP